MWDRLETRDAALETIDRLNGRVVRGWDEEESDKIIVKFADSSHQRDLRVCFFNNALFIFISFPENGAVGP